MKKMQIYEPAMCCSTGLCGVSIDPELFRISSALETLKTCDSGIKVNRYNLTSAPQEFVKNAEVNKLLTDKGVEVLPIVVVDGKVVMTKRYPLNDEFKKLLDITCDCLHNECKTSIDDICGCEESTSSKTKKFSDKNRCC